MSCLHKAVNILNSMLFCWRLCNCTKSQLWSFTIFTTKANLYTKILMKTWAHSHSSQKTPCVRLMWSLFNWEYTREKAENRISHYHLQLKSQVLLKNTSSMWGSCEWQSSYSSLSLLPDCSQNHSKADEIEQSCHPKMSGSHYSICIYPSMRRKSAFIKGFYRWTLRGHYLGWTVFPVQS